MLMRPLLGICIISNVPLDRFELSAKDPESFVLSVKLQGLEVLWL